MSRPSVFDNLSLGGAVAADEKPTAAEVATPKAAKADKSIVKLTAYLPREVHEVLREIAFHERNKVHDLLMEGLDYVLKKRRHPSISELKGGSSDKPS